MNLTDFKRGDIVYHKSNLSIKMFVFEVTETIVKCSWLTKRGKYYHEDFYPYELQHEHEKCCK